MEGTVPLRRVGGPGGRTGKNRDKSGKGLAEGGATRRDWRRTYRRGGTDVRGRNHYHGDDVRPPLNVDVLVAPACGVLTRLVPPRFVLTLHSSPGPPSLPSPGRG